ncbi:DUF1667 domain-containing protein [Anaerococcus sp. ENR1011]|uniref:DUF1667 domain-containing protein n=1 Tax=Anaerococcus groningensis TaxID=3115616 RepID=A0ABW9N1W3_9FIRM
MKKQFTCINCPMGCQVVVTMDGEEITNIEGNNCKRGENYVRDEVKDPKRMVTSTVKVTGSKVYSVPVKTETAIPKGLIFDCMKEINNAEIKAPVHIGDVVIANVLDTGVDVIATDERA